MTNQPKPKLTPDTLVAWAYAMERRWPEPMDVGAAHTINHAEAWRSQVADLERQLAEARDLLAAVTLAWRAGEKPRDYSKLLDNVATWRKAAGNTIPNDNIANVSKAAGETEVHKTPPLTDGRKAANSDKTAGG